MQVSVAIITNQEQQVLITQRSNKSSHPGKWEFPGGKLEENESAGEALIREIKEELGLDIKKFSYLTEINHNYLDQDITLIIFRVDEYEGAAACLESQTAMQWVPIKDLTQFEFPKANKDIIEHLLLLHNRNPANPKKKTDEGSAIL
ncbi:MAG: 8-oxo-dGTP diphosphatase MutT [Legionellaceae bacterium]|nr:8-oxo-dGTP diphosphatase MutT [Legionellaceae bacterium]